MASACTRHSRACTGEARPAWNWASHQQLSAAQKNQQTPKIVWVWWVFSVLRGIDVRHPRKVWALAFCNKKQQKRHPNQTFFIFFGPFRAFGAAPSQDKAKEKTTKQKTPKLFGVCQVIVGCCPSGTRPPSVTSDPFLHHVLRQKAISGCLAGCPSISMCLSYVHRSVCLR